MAFSAFPAIGTQRFKLLCEYFGSALEAWKAPEKEYQKIGFSEKLLTSFLRFRQEFKIADYQKRLKENGVKVICQVEREFPKRLLSISDCPFVLYVKADKKVDLGKMIDISVAVVGTRKMTSYGQEVTERIVGELVGSGVTIISGLALGIDKVAHRTALDYGGKTVAVLGSGLDLIYPPANKQLADRIIKDGSILVSEYPLGYPALPQNFPYRNRIISGLSLGVVVVEGTEKSGTLLTAAAAASQGREVFAIPGSIISPTSRASHVLLKQGAKLVDSARDITDELDIKTKVQAAISLEVLPENENEKQILEFLAQEPLDIDTLVRIINLPTQDVLSTLTEMELKGMVKNIGGKYVRNV